MSLGKYHHINFIRAIKSDVLTTLIKIYVTKVFCIYKKLFCNRSQRAVRAWLKSNTMLYETFLSMSVKQNLSVSVFVHNCLMVLNDVEYATFKMFVTQISNYLFVISFQLMFYKTLRFSLARPYVSHCQ